MATNDLIEKQYAPTLKSGLIWNILSILVLLAMTAAILVFLLIFTTPGQSYNPFPPSAAIPPVSFITSTPVEPEPSATPISSQTPTLAPSPTPLPSTATATLVIPTATGESAAQVLEAEANPTPTVKSDYPFALRASPAAIDSTIIHPDEGCSWMGVGGQVFDLQGAPIVGLYVQMGGTLGGKTISIPSLTGTAIQYGPAGYEIYLADHPTWSKGTLWIQLFEQGGIPISARTSFDTSEACDKNLVLINFKQVR